MKKLFILAVTACGAGLIACGQGGASLKTDTDSLSYAIGIDLGTMARSFDTTLDAKILAAGIVDAYKNATKAAMTPEQSQAFIAEYMSVGRLRKNAKASEEFLAKAAKEKGVEADTSGLLYKIEKAGSEPKVALGDSITVDYVLTLADGNVLGDTKKSGAPQPFLLQEGSLIKAWLYGVTKVGEGGKITLYVPSDLAYGDQGTGGPIGPGMALKFEIEVVKVKKNPAQPAAAQPAQ